MASNPIPQKTALNVFPYTREGWTIIDVVPYLASYTKIFRAGLLTSYLAATVQNTSYFDNYSTDGQGVSLVKTVDLTDPAYTSLATLNLAGIITHSFPENRPALGDQYGDLELQDRDLGPLINTIAGAMARTACALPKSGGLILMRFATRDNPAPVVTALAETDIDKPVYVSKTLSTDIGEAGSATIADLSGESGAVRIGTLREIPIIGGTWGHVQMENPVEMA